MNNEFLQYEDALALKELGFDERCFTRYYESGKLADNLSYLHHNHFGQVNAPLYQQVFRWVREKYGINVSISINWSEGIGKDSSYGKYSCSLQHKSDDESIGAWVGVFNTYEEAEIACLKKLIEIIKNKNK